MNSILYRFFSLLALSLMMVSLATAQCDSQAGTMSPATIDACGQELIVANYNNGSEFLEADDALQFVLHTSAGNALGTVLLTSATPQFNFTPGTVNYGTTYYISAIVGNNNGGQVDLADPCLSVAAGTPVVWHAPPSGFFPPETYPLCQGTALQVPAVFTGEGPWTYTWSSDGGITHVEGVTQEGLTTIPIPTEEDATYCLTSVSDAFCAIGSFSGCFTVDVQESPSCDLALEPINCDGFGGAAFINCQEAATYLWSNGSSNPVVTGLPPGTYWVTITSLNGCSSSTTFNIVETAPILCNLTISGSITCNDSEALVALPCVGGTPPYQYQWLNDQGSLIGTAPLLTATAAGTYTVLVVDANACFFESTFEVEGGSTQDCGSIVGRLTNELDGNCTLDAGEEGIINWMVRATGTAGDEYFDFTNDLGYYAFEAPPGDYVVEAVPPAAYWQDCTGPINLTLEDASDVDTADIHQFQAINCPLMEVDISAPLLRRCFDNYYYVNFCNSGSETAEDAHIEITLDPLISLLSSNLPYTGPTNGVYTFAVGDVAPGECGSFHLVVNVSCNAVLGQTLCAEAHVYPDSLCAPAAPTWSGAFIEVTSNCTSNNVSFILTNTGTGDMDEPSNFIVVEDGVMLAPEQFELGTGESVTKSYPANGSTYALLAQQVPDAPGYSLPSLFVEGCGTNGNGIFSTGFALQLPENDADPFISIDCQEVIGSYDPNDKRGYPLGYGDDHLIAPGQRLDYHIRFQNTGTDTAFKVVIHDVIPDALDIATLRPGTSSHPYQLEINEDTLVFIFENILLPDSNINEPASHGFVKFNIGQRAGLPLGTVIENEAAIFFDFNDPVITNQARHELGEPFFPSATQPPVLQPGITCLVYPNPFADEAVVMLQGAGNRDFVLNLYDLTGRFLRSEKITGGMGKIRKNGLAAGLYFYEITANGVGVGQGKVAIE